MGVQMSSNANYIACLAVSDSHTHLCRITIASGGPCSGAMKLQGCS